MPETHEFAAEILAQIQRARDQKRPHVEINAGELHRVVGVYPATGHRIPLCCAAMRKALDTTSGEVVFQTASGNSASFTVRYLLTE